MLQRFKQRKLFAIFSSPGSNAIDYSVVPWTTFCDPEVARCGMTEAEARDKHGEIDVFRH